MDCKRYLDAMERSPETCPDNGNKRRKISSEDAKITNKMNKNGTKVVENRNEATGSVKTRKYSRRKLTTENLKTILRYVLANKSVLAMVQNSMKPQKDKSQMEIEGQPVPAEPDAKDFVMPSWNLLTPRKLNEISKNLLEEVYSEESASDEDYEPNDEELSDEDRASSVKADDLNSSMVDEFNSSGLKPPDQISDDEDALVIALPETDVFRDKEVDKIAERTRSKICLNNTPIETIESSFKPPDITMDMYDTHCDDANWKEFICDFTMPLCETSVVGSVADDTEDEKDPEYKVQEEDDEEEEEEDEEIDYDEILGENPLEVPGDEVKDLMTEILEFAQEDKSLLEEDFSFLEELSLTFSGTEKFDFNSEKKETEKVSVQEEKENNSDVESGSNEVETIKISKDSCEKENATIEEQEVTKDHSENAPNSTEISPSNVENARKEWIIPEERIQLDEHMRMFVQLLTQSYVLSHDFSNMEFINASSKALLNDLKSHASAGPYNNNERSAFYAHNLDEALDIINEFESLPKPEEKKPQKLNKGIPYNVKKVLVSRKVFIYPELLPKIGFCTFFCASKATFSAAEDNLIALGMERFSHEEDPVIHIHKDLLPTKRPYQIIGRIKNSKLKKESENAIAYYCKHKKLPKINRVIRVFDPENVKTPAEYPLTVLPPWMESYKNQNPNMKRGPYKSKKCRLERKTKFILPRIQLVPTLIQNICPQVPIAPQPVSGTVFPLNNNQSSPESLGSVFPRRIRRRKKRLAKNQVNKSTQCPESPAILFDSCVSLAIKQEPQSEGTSEDESVENEISSYSSSECSLNLSSPVRRSLLNKRTMVTRSMSTNHSQTELSFNDATQTFSPVAIKEESSSSEVSDEECLENQSPDPATHQEEIESKTLDSSSKNQQMQIEHSIFTERSLRIVTSQGDESSDSEQSIPECNELMSPIRKFPCGIIEDAVLPPASNSGKKRQPSDFSAIRDIICSAEKRKELLDSNKAQVQPKKKCKPKKVWSMKEDQLIVSNCQRYGINKRAFRATADELGGLTPLKVKQRFIYLLKCLRK